MAAGDIVADSDAVGAGGVVDFTPAAGVVIKINCFAAPEQADCLFYIGIGGVFSQCGRVGMNDPATTPNRILPWHAKSVYLDSTITFRRQNFGAVANNIGYTGIQMR